MSYILAFGLLAVLIFVIFKLAGLNLSNIFNKNAKDIDIPYTESLENIHQITFDEEIEKALNQRNYRLAVRQYLAELDEVVRVTGIDYHRVKMHERYDDVLVRFLLGRTPKRSGR